MPEFKIVAVPWSGLRVYIASDGLWDTLNAKTGAHSTRESPITKATSEMVWRNLTLFLSTIIVIV